MTENKNEIFENPDKFREQLEIANKADQTEQQPKELINDNVPEPHQENTSVQTTSQEDEKAAEDESVPETDEEPVADYKEKKFIPKSRFNQEIEKRKVLEEQLSREKEDRIRYETQLQMLTAMQQQNQQKQAEQDPFEGLDPLDVDSHKLYMNKIHQLEQKLDHVSQETNQRTQQLQYYNTVNSQQAAFEKSHPDFNDALEHLKKVEMQVASNFYPAQQAQQYVAQKLQNTLVAAIDTGKDAAELMYNMAKTYGYSPEVKQTGPQSNLDAINSNMKKTASIHSLSNTASAGDNVPTDINSMLRDPANPRSGIAPDKFRRALDKIYSR
jgi:hypothetical protein